MQRTDLPPRRSLTRLRNFVKLERKPELDALRGLFLVWMTLTHLPTRLSDLVNQPFGFVSSAEGFVFLSALLTARLYIRKAAEDPDTLRVKLWKRALRIYGYHVVLLVLAFTLAAWVGVHTHRPALTNLLNFYLTHPFTAVVGSLLLLYCPPLLDILPMYVLFLLITPYVLAFAVRRGWNLLLAGTGLIWLLAQFGLRTWTHTLVVSLTHLQIPLQETGAFNLFAWQAVWMLGLWIGAQSAIQPGAESATPAQNLPSAPAQTAQTLSSFTTRTLSSFAVGGGSASSSSPTQPLSSFAVGGGSASPSPGGLPFRRLPHYAYPIAAAICLFFFGIRHNWLGPHLSPQTLGMQLDKWQIGWLRAINLIAFSIILYWLRQPLKRLVMVEPFLTLGKASLEVFCAHIIFVFVGLALLYGEITQLNGPYTVLIVSFTFAGLILVALREARRKRQQAAAAN